MDANATNVTKGERTRALILDEAVRIASRSGLEGLTIGTLAEATGLSKSGLFAHFGSREELLQAVVAHTQAQFTEVVVRHALKEPRGLPRLKAVCTRWIDWTESASLPGGCPLIGGAIEFDDQPGPIRDAIVATQRELFQFIERAAAQAIELGQLAADTDPAQLSFELYGIALVVHNHRRLLGDRKARERALTAFDSLLARHASSTPA
jgi:AcrR family transcriptional regulator